MHSDALLTYRLRARCAAMLAATVDKASCTLHLLAEQEKARIPIDVLRPLKARYLAVERDDLEFLAVCAIGTHFCHAKSNSGTCQAVGNLARPEIVASLSRMDESVSTPLRN
eukprot:IDg22592t1